MILNTAASLRPASAVVEDKKISFRHLYFTSNSLSHDDKNLIVAGKDSSNVYNFYEIELASGDRRQLTSCSTPPEYYLDGIVSSGLHVNGACFDSKNRALYYVESNIVKVSARYSIESLGSIPASEAAGIAHVSADGRLLCIPSTDRAAFAKDADWARPDRGIDARIRSQRLGSYLNVFDTHAGRLVAREPVPSAWVTHVQFNPADSRQILYNHEWPDQCGIRRMWIWDGSSHKPLRSAEGARSEDDWTCHEMWTASGASVIYHGRYTNGRNYIGRRHTSTGDIVEIPLPIEWDRYGHFVTGPRENLLATDGYYSAGPDDQDSPSPWISVLEVDWDAKAIDWTVVGRVGSSWNGQAAHPHPIFSYDGSHLFYSSDEGGTGAVWRLPLSR